MWEILKFSPKRPSENAVPSMANNLYLFGTEADLKGKQKNYTELSKSD